jgi:peptide/nickel transport system permease protein
MKRAANEAIGGVLVAVLLLAAGLGALWTPFDPLKINYRAKFTAPGAAHWLGTDEFGRDVLSRILAGAANSVSISLLSVAVAVALGMVIGLLSGYLRGWFDRVAMMFNDALLAFPGILLALALLAVLGANKYGIILALGIAYAPAVARVVRGSVLSVRELDFVAASRVIGNGGLYTMLRHILPNCVAPLSVLTTSMFGWAVLAESALSFLGLGVPPPAPSWGNMLAGGRAYLGQAVWLSIFPGLCIALALLGINLLGDALRDRLDPRMRGL